MDGRDSLRSQPAWLLFLCGWLFASATMARHHARATRGPSAPAKPPSVDLATSPPRELERLPGIGPARAGAIARLRWSRRGEGFDLCEVHGIGPRTEQRVQRWLLEERDRRDQPSFGE